MMEATLASLRWGTKRREEGGLGTPCLDLVKVALGKAAASVARAGETASSEAREIQQVSVHDGEGGGGQLQKLGNLVREGGSLEGEGDGRGAEAGGGVVN